MLKTIFTLLSIVGVLIITILAFTIPNNPYEIIPAMSIMNLDKPLWLCIIISGSFFYLIILYNIYDEIVKRKIA